VFETAELGRELTKKAFKARVPSLREALLSTQFKLREAGLPVIILFAGVDGAGKGETVNLLNEWMDPRWISTRSFDDPSVASLERPHYWRFWAGLPPNGQIGLLLSAWYSQPLLKRVYGDISNAAFDQKLDEIQNLEQTLADDGALILKFWMHLGKDAQEERFKSFEADPLLEWRVTERDWKHWRMYDEFIANAERLISRTSVGHAPWHIVEGYDQNYRSIRVAELILEAMQARLEANRVREELRKVSAAAPAVAPADSEDTGDSVTVDVPGPLTVLSRLDMSLDLQNGDYKKALREQQARLNSLHRQAFKRGLTTVLVFEGSDAAGKGGAIRRCVAALDARQVTIVPVAKPTDEEYAHHYLWRFWRHLPRAGRVLIFDRSWYGRVLVERVEGFASEEEWRRAYGEINAFESQLVEHGIVLLKFWLHISADEQLERFNAREVTPHKRWKLTDEDWRNRERWQEYEEAVHDMVERTSTRASPWVLVAANSKRYARVKVITSVCDALENALARTDSETEHD